MSDNDNDNDSTVPLADDEFNAFEHKLREHVSYARQLWDVSVGDVNGHSPTLYIVYRADDGGKWQVQCYTPDIITKGAELMQTMHAHITAYTQQQSISTLRGRIAYQPEGDLT